MSSSCSNHMTSTPVQRTQEDPPCVPCVQFIGFSPVVGIDTPDAVTNKGLYRCHLRQIRLQQYDSLPVRRVYSNAGSGLQQYYSSPVRRVYSNAGSILQQYDSSPVRRVYSNAGSQRRLRLLSTCDMCTSKRRLVPTEQQKRNSSKKPRMGMTVINKETVPQTVDSVPCGSVPLRQPVMGISVICKIKTIDTIRNIEVRDNIPTPCSSDLQDIDEGYFSRSLTGSLGPTSQNQPQRITEIELSATDVMTRDLPVGEVIFIRRTPQMSSECPPVCLQKREAKSSAHQKLAKLRKLRRPKKTEVQMFYPH